MFEKEVKRGNIDVLNALIEIVSRGVRYRATHDLPLDSRTTKSVRQIMKNAGPQWSQLSHDDAAYEARMGDIFVAMELNSDQTLETIERFGLYHAFPRKTQAMFKNEEMFGKIRAEIRRKLKDSGFQHIASRRPERYALIQTTFAFAGHPRYIPSGPEVVPIRFVDSNHD